MLIETTWHVLFFYSCDHSYETIAFQNLSLYILLANGLKMSHAKLNN